jgi:hypothetical protein
MRDVVLRVVNEGVTTDLDLDNNIPLRVDISSLENDKIGQVFGVGSQTFDLPGTRKNNKFFKNANDVGAIDTPGFDGFLEAFVLLDGDTIIQGKFFLQEVISSDDGFITYKCQIIDQAVDFKTQLEGQFIANADWSNLAHSMSAPIIKDSWDGNLLNGDVFYPLCDFGTDGSIEYPILPRVQVDGTTFLTSGSIDQLATPMALQQFQPAISAVSVFDVMFAQAGYNYTSSIITQSANSPFNNLFVMPKSNEDLGPVFGGAIENTFLAAYSGDQAVPATPPNTYANVTASFFAEINDPGSNYTASNAVYTAPVDGTYTLQMSVEYDSVGTPFPGVTFTLEAQVFNSSNTLINIITFASRGAQGTGLSFVQSGTRQFTLNEGDYILPFVEWFNYNQTVSQPAFNIISGSNTFYQMTVAPSNFDGVTVDIADQWDADTKTSDVLQGFIEQFNLVLVPEYGTERSIRVETFDTWMLEGREVDWTQKYDTAKRISVKHPISEQNKTIEIGNAEDNDRFSKIAKDNEPNLQYGTRQVISPSEIPLGKRKITTYFAPVIVGSMILSGSATAEGQPTYNLSGNSMFVPHLYKFSAGSSKQETFAFKPRLGYKISNVSASAAFSNTIYFGDIGGTVFNSDYYATLANISSLDTTSPIIYNLHYDKQYIDYTATGGAYQIAELVSQTNYDLFWSNYIEGLYDDEARKLTLDMQFSPEEYKDIRLNDIILVKNQKFRINKIKGFNLMYPDVVSVELLKEYPKYNNLTDLPEPVVPPDPCDNLWTASLEDGWAFSSERLSTFNSVRGIQIGNLSPIAVSQGTMPYGSPEAPTTTLIDVSDWTASINFVGVVSVDGGEAIVGTGSADDLGLLSMRKIDGVRGIFSTPDQMVIELTSASADPATEPPFGDPFKMTGRIVASSSRQYSVFTGSFTPNPTSSGSPTNPTTTAIINMESSNWNGCIDDLTEGETYELHVVTRTGALPITGSTCDLVTISVNRSGDAIELEGICCDGTFITERIEDFGSTSVCMTSNAYTTAEIGTSPQVVVTVSSSCQGCEQ